MIYHQAIFLQSAAKVSQLPQDVGFEIAFIGRSNAGKSSAINTITQRKQLAKTSKTPGRTQLINLFGLDESRRLVDLPGYGFAKVARETKYRWQKTLGEYLEQRRCLKGVILLMDIRHPLGILDSNMMDWCYERQLPMHILLTKADKLSRNQAQQALYYVMKELKKYNSLISVQVFSSLKKQGIDEVANKLNQWFAFQP